MPMKLINDIMEFSVILQQNESIFYRNLKLCHTDALFTLKFDDNTV